jgi:hypothetical protein
MSDYAWFKLLVRAIGVLLLGLSVPMLVEWVVQVAIAWDAWSPTATSWSLQQRVIWGLPSLLAYGAQAAFGYYLLFKGEGIISRVLSEIHGRCAKCGYDLRGLKGEACPECNTPLARAERVAQDREQA